MKDLPFSIPQDQLADFCRRWKITELSIFGSALREDFSPESDVDVLVDFEPDVVWDFDDLDSMQRELETYFRRPVDLVERRWVKNPFIRHSILANRHILYAA